MLVATDVAARGIDVNDVTHVINYNLPDEIENYTHRSGRTARAGKAGVSIVIINMKEIGKIRMLERIIGKKFIHARIPNGFQVCEKQLFHLVNKVHTVEVNEKEIASYLPKIYEELKDLSKEELIKRFVSEEFNRFLNYYKNSPDLNVDSRDRGASRGGRLQKLFVNLGEYDGLERKELHAYICNVANLDQAQVHNVDVRKSFSFIEVEPAKVDVILNAFKRETFNSRPVKIEVSSRGKEESGSRSRSKNFYKDYPDNRERNRGGRGKYDGGRDRGKPLFSTKRSS